MRYSIDINKYLDRANDEDKGNNCYYLAIRPYGNKSIEESFYSLEIEEFFGIDFTNISMKYGGFKDINDIFFPKKSQAILCKKELLSLVNNK